MFGCSRSKAIREPSGDHAIRMMPEDPSRIWTGVACGMSARTRQRVLWPFAKAISRPSGDAATTSPITWMAPSGASGTTCCPPGTAI